jgi:hypothetical protein
MKVKEEEEKRAIIQFLKQEETRAVPLSFRLPLEPPPLTPSSHSSAKFAIPRLMTETIYKKLYS